MSDSNQNGKVSVEDLIRLKRCEKPPAEFWTTFEQELRQKQLSALVAKRAWWQDMPQMIVRRLYVPVGAVALVAVALYSVRQSIVSPIATGASVPSSAIDRDIAQAAGDRRQAAEMSVPVADSAPVASAIVVSASEPISAERLVEAPHSVVAAESSQAVVESPSARSIAANLARLEQSEPELLNAVLGTRLSSPPRQSVTPVVAELASLQVGGSKRSRLLARYSDRQPSADLVASDSVRERVSRRLGENELNDRLSRIGVRGGQVSLKF